MRDENQLHAAVVELVALEDAEIKYSTVQNWYPGDENGIGGIYNFVTKRGDCRGDRSKISWTQVETGSAITWKYPSCICVAMTPSGSFIRCGDKRTPAGGYRHQDDPHRQEHTAHDRFKRYSAGQGEQAYRGLVQDYATRRNARNHTQCDSLLIGDRCCGTHLPYIEVKNPTAQMEHEATTSKIGDDQLFYCRQRGFAKKTPCP